mmetsp:Transcript_23395/g.23019  ORF Transcript_23395/g.23019 Transcript_23395/m.23019 type:complete len:162 (+) Transcript_23395:159-644(+)
MLYVQMGYAPITLTLNRIYDAEPMVLTLCNDVFLIVHFLITIPLMKLLQVKGLQFNVIVPAIIICVFCWGRQLIYYVENLWIVFVFTIPLAVGQAFYANMTSKLVEEWFPEKQRRIAMVIATLPFSLGPFFGFLLPNYFVKQEDMFKPKVSREEFNRYLLF